LEVIVQRAFDSRANKLKGNALFFNLKNPTTTNKNETKNPNTLIHKGK